MVEYPAMKILRERVSAQYRVRLESTYALQSFMSTRWLNVLGAVGYSNFKNLRTGTVTRYNFLYDPNISYPTGLIFHGYPDTSLLSLTNERYTRIDNYPNIELFGLLWEPLRIGYYR